MKIPRINFRINFSWLIYGVLASAIVHIVATLVPVYFSANKAYGRLTEGVPANAFIVLPSARPGVQVVPYQVPGARMAICRFDASSGPVAVSAELPTAGWTLSMYSADGSSFYEAPGRSEGTTLISLLLVPPGGHFLGVSGSADLANHSEVATPESSGLVVIRAPLGGFAYAQDTERAIRVAKCTARPFSE
ncbi:MAG: hypothetical protein RLZ98_2069 [Pseudomonadota bacterium]|jgi:uncharacterized membrane protein